MMKEDTHNLYMYYRKKYLETQYPEYYNELLKNNQLEQHLQEVQQRTDKAIQQQIKILNDQFIHLRLEMTEEQYENYLYKTAEERVLKDTVYVPYDNLEDKD